MRVLGLSCDYHDAAAALVVDGVVVAAAEEERFTRQKHDSSLPVRAIASCLAIGGLAPDDLDAVVFHEKPLVAVSRMLAARRRRGWSGARSLAREMPQLLERNLMIGYRVERVLRDLGGTRPPRLVFSEHHLSHAAAAFLPSPFEQAAILTVDGIGEWATASYGRGAGRDVTLLAEQRYPDSVGLLYSLATHWCGFEPNDGEYKLMGLAPYGDPTYLDALRDVVEVHDDGSITVDDRAVRFWSGRTSGSALETAFDGPPLDRGATVGRREADIARSVQDLTEEIILTMATHVHEVTGERSLCLAGGVALNCVANGRLLREGPFDEVWVQPAAGDAGSALGAALWGSHGHLRLPRSVEAGRDAMGGTFLGPAMGEDEVVPWLEAAGVEHRRFDDRSERDRFLAGELAGGHVVGLFQGRMEFGPRALGHRSILADPRDPDAQRELNLRIKGRESFRPFAPAVLADRADEWFEIDRPSPYMLFTHQLAEGRRTGSALDPAAGTPLARPEPARSAIPACTHVDHSARVQTVDRDDPDGLGPLLAAFEAETACPVLVNTSFNRAGEPIVATPADALGTARDAGLDLLVLDDVVVPVSTLPDELVVDPGTWRQAPAPPVAVSGSRVPAGLLVALVAVVGPALVAAALATWREGLAVAGITAVAAWAQHRVGERRWWARLGLAVAGAAAVDVVSIRMNAVWVLVALVAADLVVRERRPVPFLPAGHRSSVPGLVALSAVGVWAGSDPTSVARLRPVLVGLALITAVSCFAGDRFTRLLDRLAQLVSGGVAWVTGHAIALPLVLVPWLADRITGVDPVRPPRPSASSWRPRRAIDPRADEPWAPDPVVIDVPVSWRLRRAANATVVAALVIALAAPVAVAVERRGVSDPAAPEAGHSNTDPNERPAALADADWYDDYSEDINWLWQYGVAWSPLSPVRVRDVHTRYINVVDGARTSWRAPECDCRRVVVWMYGGSTTFGLGQRDEYTTASAIARAAWDDDVVVDVVNRGVPGDTHWEEAQRLGWDLATLPAPDLVIFLDGINEIQALNHTTTVTRQPTSFVEADFWGQFMKEQGQALPEPGSEPIRGAGGSEFIPPAPRVAESATADGRYMAERYDQARSISRALAADASVPVRWFWQPIVDTRPVVDGEVDDGGRSYSAERYLAAVAALDDVIDITDTLDDDPRPLYWDLVHTNEAGADLVGKRMYSELRSTLRRMAASR